VIVAGIAGATAGLGGTGCDDHREGQPPGGPMDTRSNKPRPDGPGGTISPGRLPNATLPANASGDRTAGAPGAESSTSGVSIHPETAEPPTTQPTQRGGAGDQPAQAETGHSEPGAGNGANNRIDQSGSRRGR
jgi:hypothetical protein